MSMQQIEDAANAWRVANPEHLTDGVVLVWDGRAYGWKDRLRDPQHERPGVYAVDVHGHVWQALGGNERDGAVAWDEIERPVIDSWPVAGLANRGRIV